MKKSAIKYIRCDCTHMIPSQYNYAMCLFLSPLDYYFPVNIIKRIEMKISQLKYRRCRWTKPLRNYENAMCMKLDNADDSTIITLKRIEWNNQY